MASQSPPTMVPPKPEPIQIKDDPDPKVLPVTNGRYLGPINVKKEEPDDGKVDATLQDAGQSDMFEDVDGPEVVDLTYEGIAEIDGVDHFVCEDFKIPQIPKPMIVTRPLKSLFDCIDSGHIVLDPDYQREVVWDEGRASLLITSILMGYFIPPIIFNVKNHIVNRDGHKEVTYTRICVDGKQRLTSVHKFMKGQIGFFDSNSPQKKWYFCHPVINGHESFSNHNILPRAVKEFFITQAFCCYEYDELTLETEETMFQLVQRGIALTPAEKMRAMSTEWAIFTKQYEDDYTLIVNLSKQNRASGFRLVLTIFTMIQEVMSGKRKRSSAPTLQASPQALLKVLDDKAAIEDSLKLKFKAIFDRYENLVKLSSTQITATKFKINTNSVFDPAPDFLRAPGVEHVRTFSPLELIGTAILVSYHIEHRTDQELLDDVKAMRYYLRIKHKDLRVNAQCWVTVWEFVTEEMKSRKPDKNGRADGRPDSANGEPSGAEAEDAPPHESLASKTFMGDTPNVNSSGRDSTPMVMIPGASSTGIVNGSGSSDDVAKTESTKTTSLTGNISAHSNASKPRAPPAEQTDRAQMKRETTAISSPKNFIPKTKVTDERSASKHANSKPRLTPNGVKEENKTKSPSSPLPKRRARGSKSSNRSNGAKPEDETASSPSKRANPSKNLSTPSKKLKQKA